MELTDKELNEISMSVSRALGEEPTVLHPAHYCEGRKYEPVKVIADWDLNFNLGSAVKYIARAGRKDNAVEDLQKAILYLEFEISRLKGEWL